MMRVLFDNIVIASLYNLLAYTDEFATFVRVRSLKNTSTLTEGKEYLGVRQKQLRGWHHEEEIDVITLIGDKKDLGSRDYGPKSFEILESREIEYAEAKKITEAVERAKKEARTQKTLRLFVVSWGFEDNNEDTCTGSVKTWASSAGNAIEHSPIPRGVDWVHSVLKDRGCENENSN